jgi:hypothetical protein
MMEVIKNSHRTKIFYFKETTMQGLSEELKNVSDFLTQKFKQENS